MTSLQIQYFLKVSDCMSFTQAAKDLIVAQSSVSRQIQLLEKEIGYELFQRTDRRNIHLTKAGIIFRNYFLKEQEEYEKAQALSAAMKSEPPIRLRVGYGQEWDLTPALLSFRSQVKHAYPQAELTFESWSFLELHNLLEAGQLDVIICTKTSILSYDDRIVHEIGQLESRAYVRKGLLRPENEVLCIKDFEGETLLMLPEEEAPMSLQIIQLQFLANKVKVHHRRLPNRESIHQAILMGEGFSVFDNLMWIKSDPSVTWCLLDDMIPICMVQMKKNQNPLIPLLAENLMNMMQPSDTLQDHTS